MANTYNSKVAAPSGSIPPATLAKGVSKDAPGDAGASTGGKIPGFGGSAPDRSTINGSNGSNPGFGSPSGHLAATPSNPSDSQITGFSGNGMKPGKI